MTTPTKIRQVLKQNHGVLRLMPIFVPRRFSAPRRRLRLHPDDYFALGTARGAIKERWFSSVITCMNGPLAPSIPRRYRIASSALTPTFIGDGPLASTEVEREIAAMAQSWSATGRLPSQEGETGGRTVGYDYGFLLLGMDRIRHPQAGALARRTLDLLDPTGAWVEYYADGQPQGTRCRPWESAINCLAILEHLRGGRKRQ